MIYWTGDKGGDDGAYNPMQFDMTRYYDGGLEGWDFSPFNYPVILVSGELYDPDYSGTRDIKEKVINEDGTGYLDVRLLDYASEEDDWVIIQFNQETKIHLVNGELGDIEDITTSQEGMDIVMDNNGTYAKDIYLTPFNMW